MALPATSALSPAPSSFPICKGQRQCQLHSGLAICAWNHPTCATRSVRLRTMAQFHEPPKVMMHMNNVREKLWEVIPHSVKDFPWKKAEEIMLQQLLLAGQEALKWSLLALGVCSLVSDVIYSISRNMELVIPFGLFVGCTMTNFLMETSQELFPISEERGRRWHLLGIGCFFALIKIISVYFGIQGQIFILHAANGGWMQVLWLWNGLMEKQDRDSGDDSMHVERINEPSSLPNQQPKKKRRKDLAKGPGEGDDGSVSNKHVKVGKKADGHSVALAVKNITGPSHVVALSITGASHVVALPSVHHEDMKSQNQMSSSVICAKTKTAETKSSLDLAPTSKVSNGDAALSLAEEKDIDRQKTGMAPSRYQANKLKVEGEISDASIQRSHDKSSYAQCKLHSGKLLNNVDELDQSVLRREKDSIRERPDLNVSEGKYSMQTVKTPLLQRKEGSSARPKSTMLEKAIRELEKMVAESARPPTMEVQDADVSSQAVKRRLPSEVKQKLAKVARLAASHGKISKELVNRLMSILGHMMQLRTLKRNLQIMVNVGLSAKKEKDHRFQQMKMEVAELIRVRVPYIKSKALEQQAGSSDDFQEICKEEKEVIKRKYSMDDALEDKICDLYDLYVEGLDEDAGPQVRKLYAELAELWPDGFMDNHGIKRAICRAKDRKRALYSRHKVQEKIRRKKLIPKTGETVQVETSSVAQPQYTQEKLVTDSNNYSSTSLSRPVPNATATNMTVRMPSTLVNGPNLDRPKQEKVKGSSNNPNDTRTMDALTKKKVKRKPELELGESQLRPEKLTSAQGEERHKSQKPSVPLTTAAAAAPYFEQSS